MRVTLKVDGNERLFRVAQIAVGRRGQGLVHLRHGGLALHLDDHVDQRDVRGGYAHGQAIKFILQFRYDQGDSGGGTGFGRHHGQSRGAGPAQVRMGKIEQSLVTGVGVDGGHQPPYNTEVVENDLGHRGQAVGRAGGVGEHVMLGRVIFLLVDAHDDGLHLTLGGRGDDHLGRPGVDMRLGRFHVGEQAGALEHVLGPELRPGYLAGLAMTGDRDASAVDHDGIVGGDDLLRRDPHDGVVFEQMGNGLHIGEVVDAHDLDVGKGRILGQGPEDVSADSAETVNSQLYGHTCHSLYKFGLFPGCHCTSGRCSGNSRRIASMRAALTIASSHSRSQDSALR